MRRVFLAFAVLGMCVLSSNPVVALTQTGNLANGSGGTFNLSTGAFKLGLTDFTNSDPGQTLSYTFLNDTGSSLQVAIAQGTVLQTSGDYFTGGVSLSFGGTTSTVAQGVGSGSAAGIGPIFATVAANSTVALILSYGAVVLGSPGGAVGLDIDFTVATVPVPAGVGLLLAGLTSLAIASRRKMKMDTAS